MRMERAEKSDDSGGVRTHALADHDLNVAPEKSVQKKKPTDFETNPSNTCFHEITLPRTLPLYYVLLPGGIFVGST